MRRLSSRTATCRTCWRWIPSTMSKPPAGRCRRRTTTRSPRSRRSREATAMIGAGQDGPQGPHRVSVVIPCHNGERYVAETLGSVLRQQSPGIEVLVVDDGSTDRTREVVEAMAPAVRYLRQPHGGAARARNGGVAQATGNVLAFLDADDLWPDGALRALLAPLEADAGLGMVVGHMEQFVSPELPEEARRQFRFSPDPVPARMCGSVIVRRWVFDAVGGFSTRLETGEF